MRLINRPFYMDKLSKVAGSPDIKVITGIRRCGKSKLLEAFASQLRSSDPSTNVIRINFNLLELSRWRNTTRYTRMWKSTISRAAGISS